MQQLHLNLAAVDKQQVKMRPGLGANPSRFIEPAVIVPQKLDQSVTEDNRSSYLVIEGDNSLNIG